MKRQTSILDVFNTKTKRQRICDDIESRPDFIEPPVISVDCDDLPSIPKLQPPTLIITPPNDIGYVRSHKLHITDDLKHQLIRHHVVPGSSYQFPTVKYAGKSRSFQRSWFSRYDGLVYSPSVDGVFCIHCALFGSSNLGILSSTPLTDMSHAHSKLNSHFGKDGKDAKKSHLDARIKSQCFVDRMEGKCDNVHLAMDRAISDRIKKNREVLKSLVKCVILCGRQNIPLRGHRDDSKHVTDKSFNSGNFQAMVDFRMEAGDTVLKDYLDNAPLNCTYRSKTIQNEIIDVIKDIIIAKLVAEVKEAKWYSVSSDEKADCANLEQASICLRFVDEHKDIREVFMGFSNVTGNTTGHGIATTIKQKLTDWGLQLEDCRGQTYDGAGNMAGHTNGAAALITKDYPKAIYTHCASHCLNLVLSQCTKLQLVRNMIDISERVVLFYNNSPKRNDNLQHWILQESDSSKSKLLDTCQTRFIERHDAFEVFSELYPAIVASLEDISTSGVFNRDSTSDATSFLNAITTFEFLVCLVTVKNFMGYTVGLSRKLQGRTEDVISAFKSVDSIRDMLQEVRNEIEDRFVVWHDEAVNIAKSVDVQPALPRRCGRQRNRDNTPAETTEVYYRRVLAIPYLDDMLMGLQQRFSALNTTASSGLSLVPTIAVTKTPQQLHRDLENFLKFYGDDLPSAHGIRVELERWQWHWKSSSDIPATAAAAIKLTNSLDFPNIFIMLQILCTMGVTTCECERSNSELGLLKSYLRSTMGEDRLNGLALMHVHYGIELPLDDIVNRFARKHPRRMKLGNIIE